jgi:hypothetical protein
LALELVDLRLGLALELLDLGLKRLDLRVRSRLRIGRVCRAEAGGGQCRSQGKFSGRGNARACPRIPLFHVTPQCSPGTMP